MNILVRSINIAVSSIEKVSRYLNGIGRLFDHMKERINAAEELINRFGKCMNVFYMMIRSLKALLKK